jgi:formyltetrahydrofolate deformylase
MKPSVILLAHCPDKSGLVAAVSSFISSNNGNILHFDQHVDSEKGTFFMRVEWVLESFAIPRQKIGDYFQTLVASKHNLSFELFFSDERPRAGIFVSKLSHCLFDLLSRHEAGELEIDIPFILSNHDTLEPVARRFDIPFYVIPNTPERKSAAEEAIHSLISDHQIDLIVLARYMQVLSADFVHRFPNRIINIHHSFLPAFPGAKPYHSAHARGVKIIGATSHYVTQDLDAGPIIEQDVARVTHKDAVEDLIRKGRDLEKLVLSRAVWLHSRHKILVFDNKTVVFE